jgi:hypothetical protein
METGETETLVIQVLKMHHRLRPFPTFMLQVAAIHPLSVCHLKAGFRMTHLRPMPPSVPLTFGCVYKLLAPFKKDSF